MPSYTKISKFLSLVLRHRPDAIELHLNGEGWALIAELVEKGTEVGIDLSPDLICRVVATSDKQRFSISSDGARIRANQGHSVQIDLGILSTTPPELLYHGTARPYLTAISREGITRGRRNHVHLSQDMATALRVGKRHGAPVVLIVQSGLMHRNGYLFYQSINGVWLTDFVPVEYVTFCR